MPKRDLCKTRLFVARAERSVLKMHMVKAIGWKLAQLGECDDQRVQLLNVGEANIDAEKRWRTEELRVGTHDW